MSNWSVTPSGLARRVFPAMKSSSWCAARCGPTTDSAAPYCGAMSRWFTPRSSDELQPCAGLLDGGGPARGSAEHRHTAVVAGPAEPPPLHDRRRLGLEPQDVEDGAHVVGEDRETPKAQCRSGPSAPSRRAPWPRPRWRPCRPRRSTTPQFGGISAGISAVLRIIPPTDLPASFHSV